MSKETAKKKNTPSSVSFYLVGWVMGLAHFSFHRVPRQHFLVCFCRMVRISTQLALRNSNQDIAYLLNKKGTLFSVPFLFSGVGDGT
ncbi:MAG: hypothetical protein II230_04235 [Clostridia bacterium]|nr:hypothetical protein [Clostridia bacterium]